MTSTIASAALSTIGEMIFESERNVIPYNTSGWVIVLPISLVIFFLSFFANTCHVKWCGRALSVIYPLFIAIGIAAAWGVFDDMKWWMIFPLILYGIAGFWLNDFTLRGYKELEYLVSQEGFPSFNLAIHYFRRSHYVKMREKWLEGNGGRSYSAAVTPHVEGTVTEPEAMGRMNGISVNADSVEAWLEENKKATEESVKERLEENEMDGLAVSPDELPEDESYYSEKIYPNGIRRH